MSFDDSLFNKFIENDLPGLEAQETQRRFGEFAADYHYVASQQRQVDELIEKYVAGESRIFHVATAIEAAIYEAPNVATAKELYETYTESEALDQEAKNSIKKAYMKIIYLTLYHLRNDSEYEGIPGRLAYIDELKLELEAINTEDLDID